MKLSIRAIAAIVPDPNREQLLWDDELPGFGLRVLKSGAMSYCIQYRNGSGQSRRMAIGKASVLTPDQARRLAKERLAEVTCGEDPAEERLLKRQAITVKQLCSEYLEAASKGLILGKGGASKKESTLAIDRGRIERHIVPLLGKKAVRDLQPSDINRFLRDVAAGKTATEVKTKTRGRAIVTGGKGTAARTVGLLGGILSFAVSEGIISTNPARGVKRPADGKREIRLTLDDYEALGAALRASEADCLPWQAIGAIRLLMLTGCRRGEIEGLRWSEVDFEGPCLRLSDTKTGKSIRPIGTPALDVLRSLPRFESEHVFPRSPTNPLPYTGLPKVWPKICAHSDRLTGLVMHGLRHGFASVAAEMGYSELTIAGLLGHAANSVTSRYSHLPDRALVGAAERVSNQIMRGMTEGEQNNIISLRG